MRTQALPIRFAGVSMREHRHVCAFFNTPGEEYRAMLPFIREGFERGDTAVHIVDPERRDDHLGRLRESGIDVESAQSTGRLDVRDWTETHLRGGRFDPDRMLALLNEVLAAGAVRGRLTRFISHMEWALQDAPGVEALIEYEARANYVLPRYRDPVICVYDASRFGADVAIDIIRTHPMVVIGGVLTENPFFVPPEELLRELRGRSARRSAARLM